MIVKLLNRDGVYIHNIEAARAKRRQSINGEHTLEFETQDMAIEESHRIIYREPITKRWREFIVTEIDDAHDQTGITRTVYAEDSFYETIGDFIEDRRFRNATATAALSAALEYSRWEVGQVDDLGLGTTNFYRESVKEAVQKKILETWHAEFDTRIEVSGNQITRRIVDLRSQLGATLGKRFVYDKDMTEIRRTVSMTEFCTAPMRTRLAAHGAIPIEVPTISIEPPRSPAQMERAVKGLVDGRYQWVVFTSVNAVHAVWDKFTEFGLDARSFAGIRIAAVGHKTAEAIRELGITPELLPDEAKQNAAGVVDVFPEFIEGMDPVNRVLLPRADIGTDVLVDGLVDLGWEVDDVTAYRTVRAAPPSAEIRDMIKSGGFDAVCFTSSSTVKNLVGIAGKPHPRTIIACIGPMAAATAREYGLRVDVQPERAGIVDLVDALAAHMTEIGRASCRERV